MIKVLIVHTPPREGFDLSTTNDGYLIKQEASVGDASVGFLNVSSMLEDKINWNDQQICYSDKVVKYLYGATPHVWFSGRGCCEFTRMLLRFVYESDLYVENHTPHGSIVDRLICRAEAYRDILDFGPYDLQSPEYGVF